MMYSSRPNVVRIRTRVRVSSSGRLDPVHAWHPDVHQYDIGAVPSGLFDRLLTGAGLGDDFDVAGALEQSFEPGAEQRLVVGDDYP